ncbi:MAG: glycosyltransferase [Candidatus Aenigmatarchaeota archaeon]
MGQDSGECRKGIQGIVMIAILHDYFDKRGGGERLVLNLARALGADIYTGFVDYNKTFDTDGVKITSLGISRRLPHILRNLMIAKKFEKYKFPNYDAFVFSGTWCITAAKNHPNILYLHTPPRYLYDLNEYFIKRTNIIQRPLFKMFMNYWKKKDQIYMRQFDRICPNSENVKNRVRKFYGEDAYKKCDVVYTGIETKKFYCKPSEDFYLSTSRLDPLKRVGLVVEAFKKNGKRLVVASTGPEESKLNKLAEGHDNIEFVGNVSEEELIDLYARCKATVVAAMDEDLGLSAIESQCAGKPVIAVREGGLLETVNKNTGVFFEPSVESLINSIGKFEKMKWNNKLIQKNAERFDIGAFVTKMKKIISDVQS